MHAIDLITPDVPPLRPQDDVGRALDWMEEFKVSHLPVVEGGRLVGLVKDQDLVVLNTAMGELGTVALPANSRVADIGMPNVHQARRVFQPQFAIRNVRFRVSSCRSRLAVSRSNDEHCVDQHMGIQSERAR